MNFLWVCLKQNFYETKRYNFNYLLEIEGLVQGLIFMFKLEWIEFILHV